jgi:hypothetical protein
LSAKNSFSSILWLQEKERERDEEARDKRIDRKIHRRVRREKNINAKKMECRNWGKEKCVLELENFRIEMLKNIGKEKEKRERNWKQINGGST